MAKILSKINLFKVPLPEFFRSKLLWLLIILFTLLLTAWFINGNARDRYQEQISIVISDRNGRPLSIKENVRGHYTLALNEIPTEFEEFLIKKEDRFFYYHPGVNPISSLRAIYNYLTSGRSGGSSTLTQQLTKNLLGTESERNLINKFIEALYALCIEFFNTKKDILLMYANTVYLGNQVQGFETGSLAYFGKTLSETTVSEKMSLLATLSYPSSRNPWEEDNSAYADSLSKNLNPEQPFFPPELTSGYSFQTESFFEIKTAGINCLGSCQTTIDNTLTEAIRKILKRSIQNGATYNIKNGAVVVIDTKTEELLALVGSHDPRGQSDGNQINMALAPRPIGSTIKPFIYAKGFEKGLRPYTTVEDREYKYPIATGFPLYPKNYDGRYRGEVTLHEALSNSLNVPSIKILEYIGLFNFYTFLSDSLKFKPIQNYDNYQYGIALGGLEMDLLTLTHYFSIFARNGTIAPLRVLKDDSNNFNLPPQSDIKKPEVVIDQKYNELVHAIINDRFTGVNQFGLESNLNLNSTEYGVKTGTSRDFHDSWVVGYTPDYVVGVWLGNTENTPMRHVSGQSGAGEVWRNVMEYLQTSDYVTKDTFSKKHLKQFTINDTNEWGLVDDIVTEHLNLLTNDNLILAPHDGDIFEFSDTIHIPLQARRQVTWSINGEIYQEATGEGFKPTKAGTYEISAYDKETSKQESILIKVILP